MDGLWDVLFSRVGARGPDLIKDLHYRLHAAALFTLLRLQQCFVVLLLREVLLVRLEQCFEVLGWYLRTSARAPAFHLLNRGDNFARDRFGVEVRTVTPLFNLKYRRLFKSTLPIETLRKVWLQNRRVLRRRFSWFPTSFVSFIGMSLVV